MSAAARDLTDEQVRRLQLELDVSMKVMREPTPEFCLPLFRIGPCESAAGVRRVRVPTPWPSLELLLPACRTQERGC